MPAPQIFSFLALLDQSEQRQRGDPREPAGVSKKCNDILFDYFFSRVDFSQKKEKIVTKAKEVCDEKAEQLRIAKSEMKVAENELNKALAMTFEEWQADRQQLTIPGFE